MPLGFFGGGGGSNKPQVLTDDSTSGADKKETQKLNTSNCKGVVLELNNSKMSVDRKLAEGGFAIVYKVIDKNNKKFALKRQFVKDNQKQLDACVREFKILSELKGHRNIVEYIDHSIVLNKYGQYDCMLLTAYYKRNVLQLMNEKSQNRQYFSPKEVLDIMCDICEAVGRLHHCQTPVIHRDLKVENILVDERNQDAPPIFVLCDFGSATTKTMSMNTHSAAEIQDEIERNTTLCYRSPEMVDIYGGQVIGSKTDLWSLGVLLYRLCYFDVPFDESALAIQNCKYAFPKRPKYPPEIRAIMYSLFDVDVNRRPSIYECASMVFEANGKPNPIENVYGVQKPSLKDVIVDMKKGKRKNQIKTPVGVGGKTKSPKTTTPPPATIIAKEEVEEAEDQKDQELVTTSDNQPVITTINNITTTSVNPRLRPKPTQPLPTNISQITTPILTRKSEETTQIDGGPLSCPIIKPADLGFTDLDNTTVIPRDRAATDSTKPNAEKSATTIPESAGHHRRNVSDTSQISKSAFKPYSQTTGSTKNVGGGAGNSQEDVTTGVTAGTAAAAVPPMTSSEWNPFLAAPFSTTTEISEKDKDTDDDETSSIDMCDPFGSAPFDRIAAVAASAAADQPTIPKRSEGTTTATSPPSSKIANGNNSSAKKLQTEDDSEIDEQRMNARRRYSYENIDGVGDDATSSDSRGRTDRDDSEDDEETDECSRPGGGDTSHEDDDTEASSQNTVGSEDGEGGSRPLLEDDGLEDDDDNELLSSFSTITSQLKMPLFIGTYQQTNPFLRDELMMTTPQQQQAPPLPKRPSTDDDWDLENRWADRRDTVINAAGDTASATLPRQVTPLIPAKLKPELPAQAPVSIIPSMSTTSFPEMKPEQKEEEQTTMGTTIGTLIQVGGGGGGRSEETPTPTFLIGTAAKSKPKNKKETTSSSEMEERSPPETDGSEAEMTSSTTTAKKKKKGGFSLRSSHPSIANDIAFATPIQPHIPKKMQKDKKSTSSTKRSNNSNSSFINSSFQCEEADCPTGN